MTTPEDRTPNVPGQPNQYWPPQPPPAPPYGDYAPVPPPEQPKRFKWNSWRGALSLLVIIGGLLFLIGGISDRLGGTGGNEFAAAQKACDSNPPAGTTITDGGRTLIVNMQGAEDTSGITASMTACVLRKLHVTGAVVQHMDSTRALDGRQSDRWAGYTASWTYHPNAGLDIVIQRS